MKRILTIACLALAACSQSPISPTATTAGGFDQIIDVDARLNNFNKPVRVWLEPGIYQVDPVSPANGGKFIARHAWAGENEGCDRLGIDCLQGWQWTVIVYSNDVALSPLNRRFHNGKPIVWIPGDASLNMPPPTMFAPRAKPEIAFTFAPHAERFRTHDAGYVLFFDVDRQAYDNLGGISFRLRQVELVGPDSDGDMYADDEDAFPHDPTARIDSDGDGYPDRWVLGQEKSPHKLSLDAFPYDASRHQLITLDIE